MANILHLGDYTMKKNFKNVYYKTSIIKKRCNTIEKREVNYNGKRNKIW